MKGKIDECGVLYIERRGGMKPQECPFTNVADEYMRTCGDWCPLFGEPEPELHRYNDLDGKLTGRTLLALCQATLEFDNLEDLR